MTTNAQYLKHLLWRMGFGPRTQSWNKWLSMPPADRWLQMKKDAAATPQAFDVADDAVKGLLMGFGELGKMERRELDKDQKQQLRRQSRENLQHLNLLWLEEMTHSKAQLREKMALFWHGHFASRNINILYQQQLLAIIREKALGNFGDLLRAVSKSAAMLAFLNNQQNKKQHPNENFAREVMELFTLGRGHYTENDIKEAARAFTGWGFQLNGDFVFRKRDHDSAPKTILGKYGPFDGDQVLDILLEQRQTARFIAGKLYRFLVNEHIVPQDRVDWLGDRFYNSGYEIVPLLDAIAESEWFYDQENIGANIKSPVCFWVGIRRALPLELQAPEVQLTLQKALGQVLFYPPNVAGWPGGRDWIDSSSLMLRLRVPELLYANQSFEVHTKTDDDQQMGEARPERMQQMAAQIDWKPLVDLFERVPETDLPEAIAAFLWQTPLATLPQHIVEQALDRDNRHDMIVSAAILLMATPEYQLA